jgi:hypothetical protein
LITMLWGARQAIDSIVEEYRDRTWDTQRLSALSPWDMTWGKLFGSTIMVWYGGTICLLLYSLATENLATLPLLIFYSICSALLVQSSSLLLGLLAVQRDQFKSGSTFLVAIIGLMSIAPWLMEISNLSAYPTPFSSLLWYGILFDSHHFHQVSLLLALFWCGVGSYRLMSQELGMRTQPWVWLGFSLFLIVYAGGFIPGTVYSFSLAVFLVCSVLTYIGVIVERNDAMRLKRLLTYFSQSNWRRASEEMPIWWLTAVLTLPAACVLSFSDNPLSQFGAHFHFYPLAMVLILLRDCAIYLYFYYGKNPQRAFSLTLVTGVLLYGIIPGIFNALGQNGLAALFFPLWTNSTLGAFLSASIQTSFVLNLLYQRWKTST